NERWSMPDFQLELALRDRLVGVSEAGALRVANRKCDGIRDEKKKVARKGVREVCKHLDGLIVTTATHVYVVDGSLRVVERFAAPATNSKAVLVDGALMYVDRELVMRADQRGCSTAVCGVPTEMASAAITRWEQTTGIAALDGVWMARWDPEKPDSEEPTWKALGIGERSPFSAWRLHRDEAAGSLFLVNHTHPHVVIALESD